MRRPSAGEEEKESGGAAPDPGNTVLVNPESKSQHFNSLNLTLVEEPPPPLSPRQFCKEEELVRFVIIILQR